MSFPTTFMWPQYLWLLLAVPLLVPVYVWLLQRKKRLVLRYASLAIVTFAGSAQLVQPATLSRENLLAAIDRFRMQRGTAVGSGIVVSLAELFPDEGMDLDEMTYGSGRRRQWRREALDRTGGFDPGTGIA